ncbi:proliferating cell nuclear antigen (pcna) [Candidatus Woesearchaeota archaeon]|nr:proliferating cell nuclear antigen (pcna) [Candidatus Woesearchaeota archaeon]
MFVLKLNEPKILDGSIGVISDFITEATFTIKKEGIKLVAMDPANISMVILNILPSAFIEYRVEDTVELTINLENLKNALKRVRGADSLTLTLEKNKLKLISSGKSKKRFFIPLLEREVKERKIPSLDFMATVEVDAKEFKDYVDDVSIAGDAVTFDAEKNVFSMSAGDAGSKVNVELTRGHDALVQIAAKDPVRSVYSVDYLKKIAKSSTLADSASLRFAKDYPLRLDFRALNKLQMSFILAPRIENK